MNTSPFLSKELLIANGFVLTAGEILEQARAKHYILHREIINLIRPEIRVDRVALAKAVQHLMQVLTLIGVSITIAEPQIKPVGDRSPEVSYLIPLSKVRKQNKVDINDDGDNPSDELVDNLAKRESIYEGNLPAFYVREIKSHKVLTRTEANQLFELYGQTADLEYRNKILVSNVRLSWWLAGKLLGRGLDYEDLIQEGTIGLVKAIDRFDYKRGFTFTTYARWWVQQCMHRAIDNMTSDIRLPVHAKELR